MKLLSIYHIVINNDLEVGGWGWESGSNKVNGLIKKEKIVEGENY